MRFRVGRDNHENAPVTLDLGAGAGINVVQYGYDTRDQRTGMRTGGFRTAIELRFTRNQAIYLGNKLIQAANADTDFDDESTDFDDREREPREEPRAEPRAERPRHRMFIDDDKGNR